MKHSLTIEGTLKIIKSDPSYKVLSSGQFAILDAEAIFSEIYDSTNFTEELAFARQIIFKFCLRQQIKTYLRFPNNLLLHTNWGVDVHYWETMENVEKENRIAVKANQRALLFEEWKVFFHQTVEEYHWDDDVPQIVINKLRWYYDYYEEFIRQTKIEHGLVLVNETESFQIVLVGTKKFLGITEE